MSDLPSLAVVAPSAEDLEHALRTMGALRAQMSPPVPAEPPAETVFLLDPTWRTFFDPAHQVTILQFRHPSFGWLSFGLPVKERDSLAHLLGLQQAANPPVIPH